MSLRENMLQLVPLLCFTDQMKFVKLGIKNLFEHECYRLRYFLVHGPGAWHAEYHSKVEMEISLCQSRVPRQFICIKREKLTCPNKSRGTETKLP